MEYSFYKILSKLLCLVRYWKLDAGDEDLKDILERNSASGFAYV